MTDDRRRTAIHEAAHCALMTRWSFPITAVSIRPGESHRGVTIMTVDPADRIRYPLDGTHPLDGPATASRQWAERRICVLLAGSIAADLLVPVSGFVAPPREYPVELAPPAAAKLAEAEADPESEAPSDDEIAFEFAFRLVGQTANAYLAWLRLETHRLVAEEAPAIYAVAEALLRGDVLDGASVGQLIGSVTEEIA